MTEISIQNNHQNGSQNQSNHLVKEKEEVRDSSIRIIAEEHKNIIEGIKLSMDLI